MSRIVITGAAGIIGSVLTGRLSGHELIAADLPDHHLRRRADADSVVRGADQLVHLAWNKHTEDFYTGTIDPDNALMVRTVLAAARAAGVGRLVIASSVHADTYPAPADGSLLHPDRPPFPCSLYGADKVFTEALGRHYSTLGLQIVAVRFGGVNPQDTVPDYSQAERAVWLTHRDCAALVQTIVDSPLRPGRFSCVYGVSDNAGRWHSLANDFGWSPRDSGRSAPRVPVPPSR